jgi:N12 class adenine-specific DNA methylase
VAALRTARAVLAEGRPATRDERATLARWGGWGATGLAQVFDESKDEFAAERDELRGLLTADEYDAARRTTMNAHYTDPAIVKQVWRAVEGLGLAGGVVLEPGCGSGTFMGLAPDSVRCVGVEADPATAAVAALLHPDAEVRAESFAATRYPAGRFDAAVGNVPFGERLVLHDPRWNSGRHTIHNYFIVKSLGLTRPGGVVALLTSSHTMDSLNPAARREMAAMADLVAAVRLPTGAHRRAAGTDVVTDLLILRRCEDGSPPAGPAWDTTRQTALPGPDGPAAARLNAYWLDRPDMVLGAMSLEPGPRGRPTVKVTADLAGLPEALAGALDRAVAQALDLGLGVAPRGLDAPAPEAAAVAPELGRPEGDVAVAGPGRFTVVVDGVAVPLAVPKTQAGELAALVSLKTQAHDLIEAEAADLDDSPALEDARAKLRADWESYTALHGPINRFTARDTGRTDPDTGEPVVVRRRPPVMRLLRDDPGFPLTEALELFDEQTQRARPSGLMRGRLIVPRRPVLGVDSALDGLAVVLDTTGRVDLDEIARLQGVGRDQTVEELGDAVFETPDTPDDWKTRADYLSGDVRAKLARARLAAQDDPDRWSRNVAALEAVLPADVQAGDIAARLGAVWIPAPDHQDFLRHLLGGLWATVESPGPGKWKVKGGDHGVAAEQEWGTPKMPAGKLLQHLAAQKPIEVKLVEDGRTTDKTDATATQAAVDKGLAMQERFAAWLWEDPGRTARLVAEYNRRFNSTVPRDHTGAGRHLTLPGLVRTFEPAAHQRDAVARLLSDKTVLLAHPVGAGKTAEMVMGVMELKRLGLVNKPAVCVPNHMLEQFSREWLQLYPRAKILAASSDDLAGDRRRRFVARAAANDWDAVILTRTAFQRLELAPEHAEEFVKRQLDQRREALRAAKQAGGTTWSVKQEENAIAKAEESLKNRLAQRRDPGITFEQTGVDYLVIDEMHQYKNLATPTGVQSAALDGARRSEDLLSKIEWLRSRHGPRILCGATATPVSNSMTEIHVMMRYFDPEGLARAGVEPFDAFAATFAETVTGFEMNTVGRQVLKTRMARFTNLPELQTMFRAFAEVKTQDDLDIPRPALAAREDGRRAPRVIAVPRGPELAAYMKTLGDRAARVASADPTEDNMLKISSHGRMAALDTRLVDPASRPERTKTDAAADELARVWAETRDNRYLDSDGDPSPVPGALQIVFCDLSTPSPGRWSVYQALKDALVERGLPAEGVRFMQSAKNDHAKAALFEDCRAGRVQILIGSTETMGVGTNIQDRAVHLLHLDAPWRPADVEQRNGRVLRRGNQNPEIQITQIVAEESFDAVMWQTLERKARFIEQVMTGGNNVRVADDIGDDQALSFAEVKAIASGNPLLLEAARAELELQRLDRLKHAHDLSQRSLATRRAWAADAVRRADAEIARLAPIAAAVVPTAGDRFLMTISGRPHTSRADAAADLEQLLAHHWSRNGLARSPDPIEVGGLKVSYQWQSDPDETRHVWTLADAPAVASAQTVLRHDAAPSPRGAVQTLENLPAKLAGHIADLKVRRDDAANTIAQATRLIGQPFPHALDLDQARARHQDVQDRIAARQGQDTAPPRPPAPEPPAERDRRAEPRPGGARERDYSGRIITPAAAPGRPPPGARAAAVDVRPGARPDPAGPAPAPETPGPAARPGRDAPPSLRLPGGRARTGDPRIARAREFLARLRPGDQIDRTVSKWDGAEMETRWAVVARERRPRARGRTVDVVTVESGDFRADWTAHDLVGHDTAISWSVVERSTDGGRPPAGARAGDWRSELDLDPRDGRRPPDDEDRAGDWRASLGLDSRRGTAAGDRRDPDHERLRPQDPAPAPGGPGLGL